MSILPLMLMSTAASSYVASRLSQDKAEEVLERKYYSALRKNTTSLVWYM